MKFAVCSSNFGSWSDPHVAVRTARAARAGGWDGYFVWDHLAFVWGPPSADPWVTLAAVAAPCGVQDQIPAAVDVFVMLKAVFPPHPHELSAPTTDQEFSGFQLVGSSSISEPSPSHAQRSRTDKQPHRDQCDQSSGCDRIPVIPPHTHFPFYPESGIPEPLESSPCCNQPSRCTSAVRQPRSPGCRRSCLARLRRMKGIA